MQGKKNKAGSEEIECISYLNNVYWSAWLGYIGCHMATSPRQDRVYSRYTVNWSLDLPMPNARICQIRSSNTCVLDSDG